MRKIWLGSVLGPLRLTTPSTCLFPRQLIAVTASLAYLRCDRNPKEMNTVLNMLMCQRLHAQQHVQGCMHAMAWPPLFRYVLAHKSWHTAYMVQIRVLRLVETSDADHCFRRLQSQVQVYRRPVAEADPVLVFTVFLTNE